MVALMLINRHLILVFSYTFLRISNKNRLAEILLMLSEQKLYSLYSLTTYFTIILRIIIQEHKMDERIKKEKTTQ